MKEMEELNVLRGKRNISIEEKLTLNNLLKIKIQSVIMDKKNYITESYRQLNKE